MRQCVQSAKVFEQAGARTVHLCRIDELVPGLMREQRERAEFPTLFEMPQNFSGDALLLFFILGFGELRAILHEALLCIGRFTMYLADKTNQLFPRLAMSAT